MTVEAQQVKRGSISKTLDLSGEVVAIESAVIAATKDGPITDCSRREGDIVKAGDVLIEIDRELYRADVKMAQAALEVARAKLADLKAGARPEEISKAEAAVKKWEASFEEARLNYERETELFEKEFVSQQSVDQARERMVVAESELISSRETLRMLKAGPTITAIEVQASTVEEAAAKLDLAKVNLDECLIKAPFDGIISKVHVSYGDLVSAKVPLIEMYSPESLVLRFAVPEIHVSTVKAGLMLQVSFDAIPERAFSAKVELVYPQLDAVMRTRTVEARLTEPAELFPNMFARITLELNKSENALLIPVSAVLTNPKGGNVVFVVQDGKAYQRPVKTGIQQEQMVEILQGIEPDEQVIVAGHAKMKDGQTVIIIGKDKEKDKEKESSTPKQKQPDSASQPIEDEASGK